MITVFESTDIKFLESSAEGAIVCGKYDNSMWTQANCEFHHLTSDVTQCSCDEPGMYALLLSRKTSQVYFEISTIELPENNQQFYT